MIEDISLGKPGNRVKLPQEILQQLVALSPRFKKEVVFFGGHPASMTKRDQNTVFNKLNAHGQSPYLVCEKTDGVRYLLIVTTQGHYFVSREGTKSLVAYTAAVKIALNWKNNPNPSQDHRAKINFEKIIHILDGELIKDITKQRQCYRYLLFDSLVIFNTNITQRRLIDRLRLIQKVIICNKNLLENQPEIKEHPIQVHLKDFFRLTCSNYVPSDYLKRHGLAEQPTTIEFLLKYYIKCLPHENDGLIFNDQDCLYELGLNNGYLKWKPAHLNTVDFFVVPNTKLIPTHGKRVLDLYCGTQDKSLSSEDYSQNIYRLGFFNFTIVSEEQFQKLQQVINQKINNAGIEDEVMNGLIAQCKYQPVSTEQRKIFKQLFSSNKTPQQIYIQTMKKGNQATQLQVIKKLQNMAYMNFWKIMRIRSDKNNPNFSTIVTKIEESIKDDIKEDTLIVKNRQLNEKVNQKNRHY